MAAAAISAPAARVEPRPWHLAFAYLIFVGGFFYASYGLSNWVAAQRDHVPSIAFAWERRIPFLDWTIVPYWSLNLFYCASFFACRTRAELNRHALRLLTAQIIAVSVFLAIPLRYSFARPEPHAAFAWMFTVLRSFDRPFNQAPSLHLSLAVIVAAQISTKLDRFWRRLLQSWFALIGVSALTTYQHHFIDIPTGLWVGALCCALFANEFEGHAGNAPNRDFKLAGLYLAAFGVLSAFAVFAGGWVWWLLWPAGAFLIIAFIYWRGDPLLFQKRNGALSVSMRSLLEPYLAFAWLNSRLWTYRDRPAVEIASGVWLGRLPFCRGGSSFASIVDLTAELPVGATPASYENVPVLDLSVPTAEQLDRAVAAIQNFQSERPTLVCCALGYARSAAAVAAWLLATRRASSVQAAIAIIEQKRPRVSLSAAHQARLEQWAHERNYNAWSPRRKDLDSVARPGIVSQLFGHGLTLVARVVLGTEARWIGCSPTEKQRIYFANHTSHADFIVLWGSLPPALRRATHPVAAADYWMRTALRRYLAERVFGAVLVDRNHAAREHNPLEPVSHALRRSKSLIFFPEGTRRAGNELLTFKCGIYHIACEHLDIELVPVWISNLHRSLPRGAVVPAPLLCSITFGQPIHLIPGENKKVFLTRLRTALVETGNLCPSTI